MKEQKNAIADYDAALAIRPGDLGSLMGRATSYMSANAYDKAIADWSAAIQASPDLAASYLGRGTAYAAFEKHAEAISDLDNAEKLGVNQTFIPVLYRLRAASYQSLGQYQRAIADLTELIRRDPNYMDAYLERSVNYEQLGRWHDAIADTSRAVSLAPGSAEAYRFRADDLKWVDQDAEAFNDYAKVLSIDGNDQAALRGIAELHFYRGEFAKAVPAFDRALESKPDDNGRAYMVIWRYLAAMRADMESASQFREKVSALKNHDWPYPVMEFYLGHTDEQALMAAANTGSADKKEGWVCEANAYIAELALTRHDSDKARRHFTQALAGCPQAFLERLMAKREMERLQHERQDGFARADADMVGKSVSSGNASR
jgi:tetratricopeptide (TPR) repeat protein